MSNNTGTNKKVNFFQQIVFQNLAINLLMLLVGGLTIVVMTVSMQNIISTAVTASQTEAELLINEAKLRQDIISIDGAISALLGATSLGTATEENLETYY